MTTSMIDFQELIEESTDGDWLREMISFAAQRLMDLEVEGLCGAGFGERSEERVNHRNGYRDRRWETRAGAVDLKIPKLRKGTYLPAFLEPRRAAEKALVAVIQEAYVQGVSTRALDDLVKVPSQPPGCAPFRNRINGLLAIDGHVGDLEEPGVTAVQGHRCPGEGFPGTADRR